MTRTKVHLGNGARVTLTVIGEEDDPVDLTELLCPLAELGAAAPGVGLPAGGTGVDFAVLDADGPVRFFRDGKRIGTLEGLELVAAGVRGALVKMVAHERMSAEPTTTQSCVPGEVLGTVQDMSFDGHALDDPAHGMFMATINDALGHTRDVFDWVDLPLGVREAVSANPGAGLWQWCDGSGGVWHVAAHDANC
jgi:hypothetical protein